MTKEDLQEIENEKYKRGEARAAKMWDKMIHSIDLETAESISNVFETGSYQEINELVNGLWEVFGED